MAEGIESESRRLFVVPLWAEHQKAWHSAFQGSIKKQFFLFASCCKCALRRSCKIWNQNQNTWISCNVLFCFPDQHMKNSGCEGERTKRGALLHRVPYGVPKWSTHKNHLLVELNTLSTWLRYLAVHTFIYFQLSSSPALRLLHFDAVHELASILEFRRYFMYYSDFKPVCAHIKYPYGMEWKTLFVHSNFISMNTVHYKGIHEYIMGIHTRVFIGILEWIFVSIYKKLNTLQ